MERRIELSWDQRTGDVDVFRVDEKEERVLLGVVKDVEELIVRERGEVILKHHGGTATVYDVRVIRYVSLREVANNGDETE